MPRTSWAPAWYNGRLMTLSHRESYAKMRSTLFRTNKEMRYALLRANRKWGGWVFKSARANTPVKSGYMQDHVRLEFTESDNGFEVGWTRSDFVGQFGYNGEELRWYPPYVELGTETMSPRAPLLYAYEENDKKIREDAVRTIRRVLERQAARRSR